VLFIGTQFSNLYTVVDTSQCVCDFAVSRLFNVDIRDVVQSDVK